jgi:diacylglycerol O-acyltransferase / wax synthase
VIAKEQVNAVGAKELAELSQLSPGLLISQAARQAHETRLANLANPPYNTVVTNIPGPQEALFMCGARMVTQYGVGMVHDAMGIMHSIISYCGVVTIAVASDRDMMRDPAYYGDCVDQSHAEYADAVTKPRGPTSPAKLKGRTTAANVQALAPTVKSPSAKGKLKARRPRSS